jgi:hypothetical protein
MVLRNFAVVLCLLAVALGGCFSTLPPSPSGRVPSPLPVSYFTTACQEIDLRGPDGHRVDLSGAWTPDPGKIGFFFGPDETTWLLQVRDCVWGEIIDDDFLANPLGRGNQGTGAGALGTLRGHLTADFTIQGELITVASRPGAPGPLAEIQLQVEWKADGQIRLRETREPNVQGPRCSFRGGGSVACFEPVILYRVEDDPLAEFRLARDAICRPILDQVSAVGALLVDYDADPPPEPNARAALLEQIAAIVKLGLERLSALTPPDSIAAEFAADLTRREAELAELEAEAQALRRGDVAEAARLEQSILPVNQAMRQFQAAHRFSECP